MTLWIIDNELEKKEGYAYFLW